jgi:hypothetical protein
MNVATRLARLEARRPPAPAPVVALTNEEREQRLAALLARLGPTGIREDDPRAARLLAILRRAEMSEEGEQDAP